MFVGGQPRPHPKGRGPSAPELLGFLSIYVYTRYCRTTKCDMVAGGGGDLFYGTSTSQRVNVLTQVCSVVKYLNTQLFTYYLNTAAGI